MGARGIVSDRRESLGYSYTPMPNWLLIKWQRGQLSDRARDLHLAIYELAPTSVLKARGEFRILRATLARKCRRDDDEAFRKLVRREYDRGHHGLSVEGHASTGISYVIKPYPHGPLVRPVSDQKQPGNPLPEPDSEPPGEEPVGEVSDQTASLSDQETAAKPHPEPGSASSGEAACPTSLDVLDKTTPSVREGVGCVNSVPYRFGRL
jgi:hypothetical protein